MYKLDLHSILVNNASVCLHFKITYSLHNFILNEKLTIDQPKLPDCTNKSLHCITAPFNKMRTLKFKAQPTNAFFSNINQMFGDSSPPRCQRSVKRGVIKSLCSVQTTKQCSIFESLLVFFTFFLISFLALTEINIVW